MNKPMREDLEKWLSQHFCPFTETVGTAVCRLIYRASGIRRDIAIAFTRYFHGDDPAEYVIGDKGFVVTLPSFWLSIPKELVIPYIESIIDPYLAEYVYSAPSNPTPVPPPPPSGVPVPVPGGCCKPNVIPQAGQPEPYGVPTVHGDIGVDKMDDNAKKLVTGAVAHSNFVNIQKADGQ